MGKDSAIELLITFELSENLLTSIQEVSPRLHITVEPAHKPDEISADVWARTEILFTLRVLPEPTRAPLLKWVQFHTAGIDFALDAAIMKRQGLKATTLSGAAAPQVAEFVLMMMLALGHRMPALMANQSKAEWSNDRWDRFLPHELHGSTVGLVGYGSIGREIARLLQPFGVTVLAIKRDVMHPNDPGFLIDGTGDQAGNLFNRLYPPQAIDSMLKECDYVVVTLPLTPDTRGFFGANEFAAMKPTAYLIDVGRGKIVDPQALMEALQSRRIAGAALDVYAEEPIPPANPLWKMPNVIITPHISGISPVYDERAVTLFIENLKRYLAGEPLYNLYQEDRGY